MTHPRASFSGYGRCGVGPLTKKGTLGMTAITLVLVSILCGICASVASLAIGLPIWALIAVYPLGGLMGGIAVIAASRVSGLSARARNWQPDGLALR